jgi:DNA-binding NarL/FixJ family response regulator
MASTPAHESDRDACVVYGLCLCVPQAGEHDDAGNPRDRHETPSMNVLLLTARADDTHTLKVVEVEDGESVETRRALRNLLGAMQKALVGDQEGEPPALRNLAETSYEDAHGANGALPHQKLSEREFQVVHMLSKGKTVGAISKELNLSVKTVSTYRVRALKKMNFKTNAELIRYMIQYKLG